MTGLRTPARPPFPSGLLTHSSDALTYSHLVMPVSRQSDSAITLARPRREDAGRPRCEPRSRPGRRERESARPPVVSPAWRGGGPWRS
ncbi:Protein of unknown function [Micromonospora lupini str. Lupac 08]|uniref:Uncharacterized protein n=1 Tax=Micromonospora lupini str. Lupac 08 TaxID=1150864 RepID=I0L735_9ACTN|nr:Protein of unknown function [Micromonospora lupini str. Lupac 08]